MYPSQVRRWILREHDEIRSRLDRIESLLDELGPDTEPGPLQRAWTDMLGVLLAHMDLEDRLLVPALLEADAWGDVRTAELEEHHEHQRRILRETAGRLMAPWLEPEGTAALVRAFIAELRADMKREDEALLDPVVLRDDLVAIDHAGA